jgi:uncharacterized protein (DUF2147 family)
MKRFCLFLALMALSSSAHAGSYSFVVAGHHIHIEAPRHCRSTSCVSVSIPGVYRSNHGRDRDDEVATTPQPAPANPPAAAPAAPAVTRASQPVVAAPVSQPPVQPVASVPPPAPPPAPAPAPQLAGTTAKIVVLPAPPVPAVPAVSTTQTIAPPPVPKVEPVKTTPVEPPPVVVPPAVAAKPIPVPTPVPQISKVSQETEDEPADTPLGDWQTEGNKGTVRIERCGQAMCGYLLSLTSDTRGDTILINMKPKTNTAKSSTVWSGNIYSRSSGDTYYSTMAMKGANTLRVEACALGRFFCSGNDWTRIEKPSKLISSRQLPPLPPS